MPEVLEQSSEFPATLELANKATVAGHLSLLPDGRLELGSAKLIQQPAEGRKLNLRPGTTGMLVLSPSASVADWFGENPVAITAVAGQAINLEFLQPSEESARRCNNLLHSHSNGTRVSLEYPEILESLRTQSLQKMEQRLKPFLSDLADHLFDLSTRVRYSSSDQNTFYDATISLRRHNARITSAIIDQLAELYNELTPESQESQFGQHHLEEVDHLNLVDTTEFESSLAIGRMVTLGETIFKVSLEALVIRLATLIDADPNKIRLPVHVRPLSQVFQRVITAQAYAPEVMLAIFDYFDKAFVQKLERYYSLLNDFLAKSGVTPGVEHEIQNKGTLLNRDHPAHPLQHGSASVAQDKPRELPGAPEASDVDGSQAANAVLPGSGDAIPADQPLHPENIYKSVIDALNFRRQTAGVTAPGNSAAGLPAGGGWDGSTIAHSDTGQQSLANTQAIARALGGIQHDAQVRAAVEQGSSLREYLALNKQQLGELKDTAGLTAESLNQLDLVDNLFGTIKSQLDLTDDLKPALGDLHIPLAKLALLDPHFFLDRTHPARAMVDKLSQLATSANFPNKALEGRITEIVGEIVRDYGSDNAAFETALQKIDKLVAQQERALSRNIERVVRIQEGQEKLQKAQQAVDQVIAAKIPPPSAPRALVELIDNGWRDLLVLTHIKEGPDSKSWQEHIKTLDLLNLWLSEQEHGEVNEDMLMQRGLEAGTLIDMIGQQIATALPTNVSHQATLEELRETLAGNRPVENIDVTDRTASLPPDADEIRAKIEDLPRLRRWVKRLEQLETSSWLTYRSKDGQQRRIQLAWISEDRDRYIFVNERGQKVADLGAVQLARQLSRGMQPPAPADKLTVIDQSLYQTLEHVQKTLSFDRNHDSLTKLINRETFKDQMERALRHAERKHSQHALLYLNIDQFRLVNEVYDRTRGDQVLLEFARLLAQLHGKKSSSARLETDNFGVLLLDRTMEQAVQVADRIRHDIETSSVDIDGENIGFTVSIGVLPINQYSPEVAQLLDDGRTTMFLAKEQGRNRVVRFEEDQAAASTYMQEKLRVKKDLERAVANDRFVLRAQPIVQTEVSTGAPVSRHYELLLGLANKDGTLSSPEEFITSAERYGFMTLVDRWVVREAFSWISKLMDAQKIVPSLSINLSGTSVTDDSFMDYLFEQISEFGVGTSRVCFEITETSTISNLVKAADFVRAFRNIGCKFSIDDFGTGLTSHNYLRELPVDYVKIDGSFITSIHKNRNDYTIARSINDLAHFLGQETIAESVENDEIIEKLKEIGVDYLQGWGVGRPKILAEVAEDLSSIEK